MALVRGRLINVYYTTRGGKLLLHWILRNSQGKQHVVTPSHHPPYCFVDAQYIDIVRDVAEDLEYPITIRKEENSRFMQKNGIPYRITGRFPKDIGNLNRALARKNVELHEADILYTWRVTCDSGIKAFVEIDPDKRTYASYEPTSLEREAWSLIVTAWDIETTYEGGKPDPKEDRIISIAVGNKFFCDTSEEKLICDAWRYMDKHDILMDWNGRNFDRWFFNTRISILKLRLNTKTVQYIDYMQTVIYLHRDVSSKYFGLDEFGKRFVGLRKIKLEHKHGWYFKNDRLTLKEYNIRDNHIVMRGDDIFHFSDALIYVSEEAGVPISDMYFVSRIPLLIYLRAAQTPNRTRIIIPCAPEKEEEKGSKYKGGKVYETIAGLHTNVFGMDLAGSYVNIIRTFNCSPEMWNEEINSYDQHEDGIIRNSITGLQTLREHYKSKRPKDQNDPMYHAYDILQYAAKVMALTFYGELGRDGSRLYIKKGAEYITLKGQELIGVGADVAKEEYGATLIYGDTDSIYISLPYNFEGASKNLIKGLMNEIVAKINSKYSNILTESGISSEHRTVEMEAQGYYPRFYITEAKKKYVFYLAYDGNTWYDPYKFGFVGMDFRRRETIQFISKLQKKICLNILDGRNIDEIVKYIYSLRQLLFRGKLDKLLIFSYNLSKELDKYKTNPPYVVAARLARDRGVSDVSNIQYVVVDSQRKNDRVEPIINGTIPEISKDAYHYYWNRVISTMQNTLEPLINPIDLENKLLGKGVLELVPTPT